MKMPDRRRGMLEKRMGALAKVAGGTQGLSAARDRLAQ